MLLKNHNQRRNHDERRKRQVNHYYEEYLESYVDEYQKDIEELKAKLSKIKDIL